MDAPLRMCLACRQMKEKRLLIRIVRDKEGKIFVDRTFKAAGRGAYVCNSPECLGRLNKQRLLGRAFKCEVPPDVYISLLEEANGR